MTAKLTLQYQATIREIACTPVITIGRGSANDIVLNDPLVSRHHALVRQLGINDYYLIDAGSSNGSQLNGKRIASPSLLQHGDHIAIGSSTLLFNQLRQEQTLPHLEATASTVQITQICIKHITVLVSDIRGYTSFSEETPIKRLSKLMREWGELVQKNIKPYGGILEKFIGDCVYVRWETNANLLESITTALKCAQAIQEVCIYINDKHRDLAHPFRIGVGINTGYAAVDVGKENMAIGDAVNVAFRLESATKELKRDLVLGEEAFRSLPKSLWEHNITPLQVKGKKDPIAVCGLNFSDLALFLKCSSTASANVVRTLS